MKKIILILLAVVTLSSCIEFNQKYYINEDLSGKVEVSLTLPKIILDLGEDFSEEEFDVNEIEKMLPMMTSELEGVSAWKDFKFEVDEEEDVFKVDATFFFENVNMIGGSLFFISPYVNLKDNDWDVSFTNPQMMEMQQAMESNEEFMDQILESPEVQGIIEAMFANKKRYRFLADLVSVFIKQFKFSISAEFPGQVTDPQVLKVVDGKTAFMGMDGEQMVADMYKVFDHEEFWNKKDITIKERFDMLEEISQSNTSFDIYGDMTCLVKNPKGNVIDYQKEIETATLVEKNYGMADFDYLSDETRIYSFDGKSSIDKGNLTLDFLNDNQVIGASNEETETYYLILKDEKNLLPDIKSLEDYHKLIIDNMIGRLENGKSENCGKFSAPAFTGKSCELYGKIDDFDFGYIIYTMETDKDYYQILAWTLDSYFDKQKAEMERILQSFEINDKK